MFAILWGNLKNILIINLRHLNNLAISKDKYRKLDHLLKIHSFDSHTKWYWHKYPLPLQTTVALTFFHIIFNYLLISKVQTAQSWTVWVMQVLAFIYIKVFYWNFCRALLQFVSKIPIVLTVYNYNNVIFYYCHTLNKVVLLWLLK